MKLSIIIVNYNVKYYLEQCLYSVRKAGRQIENEIFVVDNASIDGSWDYLLPRFPDVHFIYNSNNEGFAAANNRALQEARGDFILFLNPDTILPEDCLEKCINFFLKTQGVGILGVRMIDGTGNFLKESKRAFPSPLTSFYKLTGLAHLFPNSRSFARYYLGNLSEKKDHEVDVLAGAFMMIPRSVIEKTGGFDETFFMYGEDIDLSYRIQKAGFKNHYFSGTTIIHFKGESTGKGGLHYVRLFYKAMNQFVKKYYSGTRARVFIIFIQAGIWSRAIISGAGILFYRARLAFPAKKKGVRILIIANEKDFSFVNDILLKGPRKIKILGMVNNDPGLAAKTLGNIEQLPGLVKQYKVEELIFCENGLGFKDIISAIQQMPPGIQSKVRASGSESIVVGKSK